MNFVFLSPHFPPNYYNFCVQLHKLGVNVLGIGDAPREDLRSELLGSMKEYYKVSDLHDYDQLLRACGFFTHQYGRLNRIESHNEHWLGTDASLRADFQIPGMQPNDLDRAQRKSSMKKIFISAGVPVARGEIVKNIGEAEKLIEKIGYPAVLKPDKGVGADRTFKIKSHKDLEDFFSLRLTSEYIMEEFVSGDMVTFDGLAGRDASPVFVGSLAYGSSLMDIALENLNVFFHTERDTPKDLEDAGRKTLKAFNIRERFFHIEFFRTGANKDLVACEINVRPPGGLIIDMYNYSSDIDLYKQWAEVVVNGNSNLNWDRKYYCAHIGRKLNRSYAHSHDEILAEFPKFIVNHTWLNSVLGRLMGDYIYLVRSENIEEIHKIRDFVFA